jgi:hypothetical protein
MVIRQSDDCLSDVCSQPSRQMARMWRASRDRSQVMHGKCMINRRLRVVAQARAAAARVDIALDFSLRSQAGLF